MIEVIHLAAFPAGTTLEFVIERLTLPAVASQVDLTIWHKTLSTDVVQAKTFPGLFIASANNNPVVSVISGVEYSNMSTLVQGQPVTPTIQVAWPQPTSALVTEKVVFEFAGGYAGVNFATMSFVGIETLFKNSRTLTFVCRAPVLAAGQPFFFSIEGVSNPEAYQYTLYGAAPTTTITLSSANKPSTRWSATTPSFPLFSLKTARILVNPNPPSFSTDQYRGQAGAVPLGPDVELVMLLQVDILDSPAVLAVRQISEARISFQGGVTVLYECFVLNLDATVPNPRSYCQVDRVNSQWQVILPRLTTSDFSQSWNIRVRGKYSAQDIPYKMTVYANGLPESESTGSGRLASFNASFSRTESSMAGHKYVPRYFEAGFAPILTLVSHRYLPAPRIYLGLPNILTYPATTLKVDGQDNFYPLGGLPFRCQLLPLLGLGKLGVGFTGACSYVAPMIEFKGLIGNPPPGEYVWQLDQEDIVASSFRVFFTVASLMQLRLEVANGLTNDKGLMYFNNPVLFAQSRVVGLDSRAGSYDYWDITMSLAEMFTMANPFTTQEGYYFIEVSSKYSPDFGFSDTLLRERLGRFVNGQSVPALLTLNGTALAGGMLFLQQGSYSNRKEPMRFVALVPGSQLASNVVRVRVPMLKHSEQPYLSYNLRMAYYLISNNNPAMIVADMTFDGIMSSMPATTVPPSIFLQVNTPVLSTTAASVLLQLPLSLTINQRLTFKLSANQSGLVGLGNMALGTDLANYAYEWFSEYRLMVVTKTTAAALTSLTLGSALALQDFASSIDFESIFIYPERVNPQPAHQRPLQTTISGTGQASYQLAGFTAFQGVPVLTLQSGLPRTSSQVLLSATLSTQAIPLGGSLRLTANLDLFTPFDCEYSSGFSPGAGRVHQCRIEEDGSAVVLGNAALPAGSALTLHLYTGLTGSSSFPTLTLTTLGVSTNLNTVIASQTVAISPILGNGVPILSVVESREFEYTATLGPSLRYSSLLIRAVPRAVITAEVELTIPHTLPPLTQFELKYSWGVGRAGTSLLLPGRFRMDSRFPMAAGTEYSWYLDGFFGTAVNGFQAYAPGSSAKVWAKAIGQIDYTEVLYQPAAQPLIIRPVSWKSGYRSALLIEFVVNNDLLVGDRIELTLPFSNGRTQIFPEHPTGLSFENSLAVECVERNGGQLLMTGLLKCLLVPGKLLIVLKNPVAGLAVPVTIGFILANTTMPHHGDIAGMNLTVTRTCRNKLGNRCVVYSARGFLQAQALYAAAQASTYASSSAVLLSSPVTHTFTLALAAPLVAGHSILIEYPDNFAGVMSASCTAASFECYAFRESMLVVLFATGGIPAGVLNLAVAGMVNPLTSTSRSRLTFLASVFGGQYQLF